MRRVSIATISPAPAQKIQWGACLMATKLSKMFTVYTLSALSAAATLEYA